MHFIFPCINDPNKWNVLFWNSDKRKAYPPHNKFSWMSRGLWLPGTDWMVGWLDGPSHWISIWETNNIVLSTGYIFIPRTPPFEQLGPDINLTWWALQIRSKSCLARNLETISGPNVNDTPLSFSPHPWTSLSGSDHSKSHSNPNWQNQMRLLCIKWKKPPQTN